MRWLDYNTKVMNLQGNNSQITGAQNHLGGTADLLTSNNRIEPTSIRKNPTKGKTGQFSKDGIQPKFSQQGISIWSNSKGRVEHGRSHVRTGN